MSGDSIVPALVTTLAWAVPIRAHLFGAHLEAYIEAYPKIIIIHRWWQSSINARTLSVPLPGEIYNQIVDDIIAEARQRLRPEWIEPLKCWQGKCRFADHFTVDEMRQHYQATAKFQPAACPSSVQLRAWIKNAETDVKLSHVDAAADAECAERREIWDMRLQGYIEEQADLLRKHFGLAAWASDARLEGKPDKSYMPSTTVAYLTLILGRSLIKNWLMEDDGHPCESGYGIRFDASRKPSKEGVQRFWDALRVLDLKVSEDESQKGIVLTPAKQDDFV